MTTDIQYCFVYDWTYTCEDGETTIRLWGLNESNETVCVTVSNFKPYLYIELPDHIDWSTAALSSLFDFFRRKRVFGRYHPVSRRLVPREKLYYAHLDDTLQKKKKFPYLKLEFETNEHFRSIRYALTKDIHLQGIGSVQLKVHEYNASPILQLACTQNLPMAGWIGWCTDEGRFITEHSSKRTLAESEFVVLSKSLAPVDEIETIPVPWMLSFDIEVYSSNPNVMPNASKPSDCIFQIACVFWKGSCVETYLLSLGNPDRERVPSDIRIESFVTEAALLKGFVALILKYNPSIITGYNILGFDMPYIIDRAQTCMMSATLSKIGMVKNEHCKEVHDQWSSSAYGKQSMRYLAAAGRIWLDLLVYARREFKFANYKLDTVAGHFLKVGKDPFSARDIFEAYEKGMQGDDGALAEVGKYCVKDAVLVQRMFNLFETWVALVEMSAVANVPMGQIYVKGQQVKVFSQVYRHCYKQKIVVEQDAYIPDGNEQYQGATVMVPSPGMYEYVVPFDFKSLYPTIIIAYNIDFSTLVKDPNPYIPDSACTIVEWSDHVDCMHNGIFNPESKRFACKDYRYRFLKNHVGVLPTIIRDMLDSRARVRVRIKELKKQFSEHPEDESLSTLINIMDKRQQSYKVSANSMYGALGVKRGYLPCMPAAMSITALGRQNLMIASSYLTSLGAQTVYGDTDSCYTVWPQVKPEDLWMHARKIAHHIQGAGIFPCPMELEFEEAVYGKFLILTKKRYMWQTFHEDGILDTTIGKKGVILARRDNCAFVRNLYERVVSHVFDGWQFEDVLFDIIEYLNQCTSSSLPQSDFIISKSVRDADDYAVKDLPDDDEKRNARLRKLECNESEYAFRTLPAHVQLAERMRQRGVRVDTGQRVEYVVTMMRDVGDNLAEKIEDPEYRSEFADLIPLDYLYYIHLVAKQLDDILDLVFPQPLGQIIDPPKVRISTRKSTKVCMEFKPNKETHLKGKYVDHQYKLRHLKLKVTRELKALFEPKVVATTHDRSSDGMSCKTDNGRAVSE